MRDTGENMHCVADLCNHLLFCDSAMCSGYLREGDGSTARRPAVRPSTMATLGCGRRDRTNNLRLKMATGAQERAIILIGRWFLSVAWCRRQILSVSYRMGIMKKRSTSASLIVIEWNGQTVDGLIRHSTAELEELARELGRLAARRDLAAARASEASQRPGSDEKISKIPAKVLN
jgi:hypothetical protein